MSHGMRVCFAWTATAACLAGCGGEQAEPEAAAPPEETLAAMALATRSGDTPAFLACFQAGGQQTATLEKLMDANLAAFGLRKAVVAAHGEDGWKTLAGLLEPRAVAVFGADDPQWLARAALTADGEKATFAIEGIAETIHMTRTHGAWKIRAADLLGPADANSELAATLGKLARLYEDLAARAAEANVAIATLKSELIRGTMAASGVVLPTRPTPPPPVPVPLPPTTQPTPPTPPLPDSRPATDLDVVG